MVLITGGATGIGYGCATQFGKHGAKVAIMSRRKPVIDAAVESLAAAGIEAFGVPEVLSEMDEWYCGKCKNHVRATKEMTIWSYPKYLCVHLKVLRRPGSARV